MASTKIRGITIELGADTSGLQKALKGVNSEIKSTQKQLTDVERLLKLDPSNTELLEQKQRLLGNQVEQTSKKLNALKEAQKQVGEELKKTGEGQEQYDALTREIAETERELKEAQSAAKSFNATAEKISATANKISGKDFYIDIGTIARKGFVDGVIDNFINKVMETLRAGGADIHTGSFSYCFKSFKDLDLVFVVGFLHRFYGKRSIFHDLPPEYFSAKAVDFLFKPPLCKGRWIF